MKISYFFVTTQILAILYLAISGAVIPRDLILLLIEIFFLLFAFWAMYVFRFRFNIFPDLRKDSVLINSGPYKIVRHPMYASLIFITLIWIINEFSWLRLIVWICLIIILHFKSEYEEKLILKKFPGYVSIMSRTKKIIPFIY